MAVLIICTRILQTVINVRMLSIGELKIQTQPGKCVNPVPMHCVAVYLTIYCWKLTH